MGRPERKGADIIDLSKARAWKIGFYRSHFGKKFKRPSIPLKIKMAVLARDKLQCVQCETRLRIKSVSQKTLSVKNGVFHHIIPLIYGGPNITENVCLSCNPCHIKVHSGKESPAKYYQMFEYYILNNKLWGD